MIDPHLFTRPATPDDTSPTVELVNEPVWRLLAERPGHLLPAGHSDWDSVLRAAIESTLSAVAKQADGRLETIAWGVFTRAEIGHPLSRVVPGLSFMLDPPSRPQAGDIYQPRVAASAFGASDRFVVAPGREAAAIFHVPGSQSGHPLSPSYLLAHEDWASGRPAPFLPGKPRWELTLHPGAGT
jgi:penicillin G amidase